MKKILFSYVIILFTVSCSSEQKEKWVVVSPDNNLVVIINQESDSTDSDTTKHLYYKIKSNLNDEYVVEKSMLGLMTSKYNFCDELKYINSQRKEIEFEYDLLHGKKSKAKYKGNELVLTFENNNNKKLDFICRVSNDGVAFRYEFQTESTSTDTILQEYTEFNIFNANGFIQPYPQPSQYEPGYENPYLNNFPVDSLKDKSQIAFPALFNVDEKHWLLLSESDLGRTYCGSHLLYNKESKKFETEFPNEGEGNSTGIVTPVNSGSWKTPWRVIIFGDEIGNIVESTLVTDLAEENKIENTDWIKPGRAAWSWWAESDSPKQPDRLRAYIDLAYELEWEYFLIDANWNFMHADTLDAIIEYANSKKVGILLWYNSGGENNYVTEAPRDRLLSGSREKEFNWLSSHGVKGIKVDFFQSDKQNIINHYLDILVDAAKHKLMVNFHGCTIPRGWERTYPNLLTMESVRGEENYKFNKLYTKEAPVQNTIIPFTRNVIGSMDFTPVAFSNSTYPHITTNAHELAQAVIFESGLQHFADSEATYRKLPGDIKKFLKEVPVVWDDTKFIDGFPGKYVILARRNGKEWYIAGINGTDNTIKINVDVSFLNGDFVIQKFNDSHDAAKWLVEKDELSTNKIQAIMSAYGGFVYKLKLQ